MCILCIKSEKTWLKTLLYDIFGIARPSTCKSFIVDKSDWFWLAPVGSTVRPMLMVYLTVALCQNTVERYLIPRSEPDLPSLFCVLTAILSGNVVDRLRGRLVEWSLGLCECVCNLVPLEWQPWSASLALLPAAEWEAQHLGNQWRKAF